MLQIADRVTVLRDGRKVAVSEGAALGQDDLVQLIIGRSVDSFYSSGASTRDHVVLEVEGISGCNCADVSLQVHRRELVGVTGLIGSGYESSRLAEAWITTLRRTVRKGAQELCPDPLTPRTPKEYLKAWGGK